LASALQSVSYLQFDPVTAAVAVSMIDWAVFLAQHGCILSCRREAVLSCYSAAMLYFRSSNKSKSDLFVFKPQKKSFRLTRGATIGAYYFWLQFR